MPKIWLNLAWKEWHEHKWKLASLTAITMGSLVTLWGAGSANEYYGTIAFMFILYLPLASAFIAMGEAASERSRGTLPLLQALPQRPRRVAGLKLVFGVATVIAPALAAIGAATLIAMAASWLGWTRWPILSPLVDYTTNLFFPASLAITCASGQSCSLPASCCGSRPSAPTKRAKSGPAPLACRVSLPAGLPTRGCSSCYVARPRR